MAKTHEGYILIADISGYTLFLSQSELEHAQEILTALLNLLVEHTPPPLVISQFEGDAVISYGLRENFFQGQTFLEIIENTYVVFRKSIERMVLNNACRCNACANISNLDLKFFVHFGKFAFQRIRDRDELVGKDIILIHRLLKNNVQERIGLKAYCLFTEAAIHQLGLEAMCAAMLPHYEVYEHLEEVQVWVQDMHAVWEQRRDLIRITIPMERIAIQYEMEFDMPPEILWDYLNKPEFRNSLNGSDRYEIVNPAGGRTAPGSVYQCYHGNMILTQTVLEWQPFEHMVIQQLVSIPIPNTTLLIEHQLAPIQSGSRYVWRASKPQGSWIGRLVANAMMPSMGKFMRKQLGVFKQQVEDHWSETMINLEPGQALNKENMQAAVKASLLTEIRDLTSSGQ